jgi:hypothetical protein
MKTIIIETSGEPKEIEVELIGTDCLIKMHMSRKEAKALARGLLRELGATRRGLILDEAFLWSWVSVVVMAVIVIGVALLTL